MIKRMGNEETKGESGMHIQARFNPLWVAGILAAIMLGTAFTAQATSYTVNLVAGDYHWTNAATFTPNGVPGIGDDVVFGALPYSSSTMNLYMDGDQEANSLTLTNAAQANNHNFIISTNRINIVKCYRQNKAGNDHSITLNDKCLLRLTEFHDLGLYRSRIPVPNSDAEWRFEGAARITYHSEYADASAGGGGWACVLNFTNASSVYLARNANSISNNCEFICTRATGNDYRNLGTVRIGRGDNAAQVWTVGAGSHPVLYVLPSGQSTALAKCGAGAVTMPDVDLFIAVAAFDCGISSNGQYSGATAGGTISANSLTVDATRSTAARTVGIVEHLLLDGQAGLEAGGAGNGRAFSVVTSNQNLKVQINNYASVPTINVGQIEVAPNGGEVYLNSVGTGTVQLNIGNNNRDVHTYTNSVAVIANTLNIASTNSYLSDRCQWQDIDANANANLEFRGDFISRSTLTNLWRTDSSTFRAIGGGTNKVQYWECMSQDNGTNAPGTNNFALAKLIVGKTATGSTTNTILSLRNLYDNNTGDSGAAEAVYVTKLEIYAGSQLHLNGLNLYYKNSGSWVKAVESQTPFPSGDGTGYLGAPPPLGTVIMVK